MDSDSSPSQAVNAISSMEAPQDNPVALVDDKTLRTQDKDEDSFLTSIKMCTPAKLTTVENKSVDPTEEAGFPKMEHCQRQHNPSQLQQESSDDSFVDKIIMRSPAKTATRIEDSVEAIDAFEDEIDEIGELIPAISCPVSHHKEKESETNAATKPKHTATQQSTRNEAAAQRPSHLNEDDERRTSRTVSRATTSRLSSIHKPPFLPTKSTKPLTRSTFVLPGDAVAQKLKEQREKRLNGDNAGVQSKARVKPAPMVVKSSKPLTQPTFELPGDAIARKLKVKREQRLKQQEADAGPKEKEYKARPVRKIQAPPVNDTTTSRARTGSATSVSAKVSPSFHTGSRVRPANSRPASIVPGDAHKRLSTISITKRTSRTAAGASVHNVRESSLAAAGSPQSSMQATSRRLTSHGKTAHQTVRGREVFERNKSATEQTERLRKEKEDAAKNARAAAAEHGRLASRQWAEKQRARKVSNEKSERQEVAVAEV